jgi:6,7-dimethyl-8-ribityllumazine synthase
MSHARLVVVYSRFNAPVIEKLVLGAKNKLVALGFDAAAVPFYDVPGAVEIPLVAQRLARSKKYDAIICLGAVIRGETSHYDYVCDQVSMGCQKVMLEEDLPVVFGILTTENSEQAFARAGGDHSDKGAESVACALEMIDLLEKLD